MLNILGIQIVPTGMCPIASVRVDVSSPNSFTSIRNKSTFTLRWKCGTTSRDRIRNENRHGMIGTAQIKDKMRELRS